MPGLLAQACNLSYLLGRDTKVISLRPVWLQSELKASLVWYIVLKLRREELGELALRASICLTPVLPWDPYNCWGKSVLR